MQQLRRLKELTGYGLKAVDGKIGTLKQVYFDDQRWTVRYFVVRTGNWLLGREVLIVPEVINRFDEKEMQIVVDLTQKQIKESPSADTKKPVSRHYEQQYYLYYGLEPYWRTDPLLVSMPPVPPPVDQNPSKKPEHPHLRSSDEVRGYKLHANDGEIGRVEDYLLADQGWIIQYLEIDTGGFFSGRKVLVSPAWIDQVDWMKEEVKVDLTCALIETAPEYDESKVVSRAYQLALFKHYGEFICETCKRIHHEGDAVKQDLSCCGRSLEELAGESFGP